MDQQVGNEVMIAIPVEEYKRLVKIEGYLRCIKDLRSIPVHTDIEEVLGDE